MEDEQLLLDAESDYQAIAFISARLPQTLSEQWDEYVLFYFLDVLTEYEEEGLHPGKLDEAATAERLSRQAQKEKVGSYTPEDLRHVVQAFDAYRQRSGSAPA